MVSRNAADRKTLNSPDIASSARPYQWRFIGGELCLDFANTAGSRRLVSGSRVTTRIPRERLKGYRELLEWATEAGIVERRAATRLARLSAARPSVAQGVWRRAVRLREALYRLGACAIVRVAARGADLEIVNSELQVALAHMRIATHDRRLIVQWQGRDRRLDGPLWAVALSAAVFLVEDPGGRLKRCPGVGCGWLFMDGTKNGRRVWCSMSDCGNRSKVKRYRHRLRFGAGRPRRHPRSN